MLLSRMDSFTKKNQAARPLLTIAVAYWSCKSQVSITDKLLFCCTFLYLLLWKKCNKGYVHNVMHVLVPNCGQGFELSKL